jgi:hypothetical protein
MSRLDLGRVGNAGQVDASVAFAQRRAELIQSGELSVAELNTQPLGALDERAHA